MRHVVELWKIIGNPMPLENILDLIAVVFYQNEMEDRNMQWVAYSVNVAISSWNSSDGGRAASASSFRG
jgi:hypothetical protein